MCKYWCERDDDQGVYGYCKLYKCSTICEAEKDDCVKRGSKMIKVTDGKVTVIQGAIMHSVYESSPTFIAKNKIVVELVKESGHSDVSVMYRGKPYLVYDYNLEGEE